MGFILTAKDAESAEKGQSKAIKERSKPNRKGRKECKENLSKQIPNLTAKSAKKSEGENLCHELYDIRELGRRDEQRLGQRVL